MRRLSAVLAATSVVVVLAGSEAAAGVPSLAPPVDGAIGDRFQAPPSAYGSGHRGIDYAVVEGTPVRSAAAGVVSFAGSVAGNLAVTIDHGDGVETTYSLLSDVGVTRGETVDEGRFIGTAGRAHPDTTGGLHFGVKIDDRYVDPQMFLGPADVSAAIHLAPLEDAGSASAEGDLEDVARDCRAPASPLPEAPSPNDNVAIAIAGIGSRTRDGTNAAIYQRDAGPWSLGYPRGRVYRFSYAGAEGRRLHRPYEARDTWGDIATAAARLREMLERVHERHPHADVDLFAHSQGGLVARAALELMASSFDRDLPRVEHLVTYGTPHGGSPLAELPDRLDRTITGGWVVDRLSALAEAGIGLPDPRSKAVEQLQPGSDFLERLEREDVLFGTRVLSLAMPHDAVVPVDHALYPGKDGRVVPPEGLNGHKSVVGAERSRDLVYAFLRDAPASCVAIWDRLAPAIGPLVARMQRALGGAYSAIERFAFRSGSWVLGPYASRGLEVMRSATTRVTLDTARWLAQRGRDGAEALWSPAARATAAGLAGGRLLRAEIARRWPL